MPENQVTSYELSRELEKNGYEQKGLWWWRNFEDIAKDDIAYGSYPDWRVVRENYNQGEIVAPTVAELGEKLPSAQYRKIFKQKYPTGKIEHFFYINPDEEDEVYIGADTEANARAKMWLYFKKEGKD